MVENRQKWSSQAEDCVLPSKLAVKLLPSKFHLFLSSAEQQQLQRSSAHPLMFPCFVRIPLAISEAAFPSFAWCPRPSPCAFNSDVPLTHLKVEVHKEQKTRCGSPATGPTHAKLVCHEGFPIPGKSLLNTNCLKQQVNSFPLDKLFLSRRIFVHHHISYDMYLSKRWWWKVKGSKL